MLPSSLRNMLPSSLRNMLLCSMVVRQQMLLHRQTAAEQLAYQHLF